MELLLNFENYQISESQYNSELEEIIKEMLRLDMRGYPVDFLLIIKEKRD